MFVVGSVFHQLSCTELGALSEILVEINYLNQTLRSNTEIVIENQS